MDLYFVTNGRWTKAEHELFLRSVELHGKNWAKCAELVQTRTVTQCRSHAQKVLNSPRPRVTKRARATPPPPTTSIDPGLEALIEIPAAPTPLSTPPTSDEEDPWSRDDEIEQLDLGFDAIEIDLSEIAELALLATAPSAGRLSIEVPAASTTDDDDDDNNNDALSESDNETPPPSPSSFKKRSWSDLTPALPPQGCCY